MLAKMAAAKFLLNPKTKQQALDDLRAAAKKTDAKWDDAAVDMFADMWDEVVPGIVRKL